MHTQMQHFVEYMKKHLPASKEEAIARILETACSDKAHSKQMPARFKDKEGRNLEKPEVTKAVFLHKVVTTKPPRFSKINDESSPRAVIVTLAGETGVEFQVVVPINHFLRNANSNDSLEG